MTYRDLRDWLEQVEGFGELRVARGAHWDVELGAVTELVHHRMRRGPAVLFDDIVDYPSGYRVLVNCLASPRRVALTLGLPPASSEGELVKLWQEKSKSYRPVPPVFVKDGPVMENVQTGHDIDLWKFPTPRWHELDGGRYIGTGSVDISRDPDSGVVNLGTYRVMVVDRNHLGFYISPGKHGRIHRDKFFERDEPMPVAMSFGHDPLIFLVGSMEVPNDVCEYDYAGWLKGEPLEVIRGEFTGLPLPARGEIVVEGIAYPDKRAVEGPFGEWTGYYASGSREEPVVEVKAVYHRSNPIIVGLPPTKPPGENCYYRAVLRSAAVEEELAKAGVPDVAGVWCHEAGGTRLLIVVAIHQRYPGHARQAGMIASFCHAGHYMGRYVIVVDEDIDITNLDDVMWAMCTRSEPSDSIEIVRRALSSPLDPMIPPGNPAFNSRAIIDACRPYEWRDKFPPVAECSRDLVQKTREKWEGLLTAPR
ncbi:MAG: UbiD family decarboxylase [Chloroflexi bacterium]|nr:UbiD family decarboxylase [Chloroflexota bacterium]